jgi:hypothetical protein
MATQIPLNTFKTTTANVTTSTTTVYTTPAGVTTVVLLAQVANIDATNSVTISANHVRGSNTTSLIKNTTVPINDAASLLTGKLILQTGDSFSISASANDRGQLVLSYLETANA